VLLLDVLLELSKLSVTDMEHSRVWLSERHDKDEISADHGADHHEHGYLYSLVCCKEVSKEKCDKPTEQKAEPLDPRNTIFTLLKALPC
jgi:hypothetical protein